MNFTIKHIKSFCLLIIVSSFILAPLTLFAQKKYQGLLWQISGNGLSRPSYLYGTMHVSEKLAFHLSDSFYIAINSVDVVSLETNPERLMDDLMDSDYFNPMSRNYLISDKHQTFDKEAFILGRNSKDFLKSALAEDLDLINGLLFRNSKYSENYQENTYLDLYIYKTGKKLRKRITGVERYKDVIRLSKEASRVRDNDYYTRKKLNRGDAERIMSDAYRRGDLDLLDSLHQIESPKGYLEKMLYERNLTMAKNIDSIIQKNPLFAAVGAAHLPNEKGIINILRQKGYTVKAVKVGTRETHKKAEVDKKKFPLVYHPQTSSDGFFQVDVPGKLYELPPSDNLQYYLYPELVNGAFYSVIRIKTYNNLLDKTPEIAFKGIDSLLYENIPGEIVSKKEIHKNGYIGFDILNKTRSGNYQRYQVFVTPIETLVFKLGGTEDFAKGKDGDLFFNSIKIKELNTTSKVTFQPKHGEFEAIFPHYPIHNLNFTTSKYSAEERQDYQAVDNEAYYLLSRVAFQHREYIEEDTFELGQVTESFAETGDYQIISRKLGEYKGYPCIDVQYQTQGKQNIFARFIIKGYYYYMLIMKPKSDKISDVWEKNPFFTQFRFVTVKSNEAKNYTNKELGFTVKTAYEPTASLENELAWMYQKEEKDKEFQEKSDNITFFQPESGEKISVSFYKYPFYYAQKDSANYWKEILDNLTTRRTFVVEQSVLKKQANYSEMNVVLSDTGSYRQIYQKYIQKGGSSYVVSAYSNKISNLSDFAQTFLSSFTPTDTTIGRDIFIDAGNLFLQNLMSKDSILKASAVNYSDDVELSKVDKSLLKNTIQQFNLADEIPTPKKLFKRSYSQVKADLLRAYAANATEADTVALKDFYYQFSDTVEMQLAILQGLAAQKKNYSYQLLKELLFSETPLPSDDRDLFSVFNTLSDSLALTKTLYPEMLALTTMEEYKEFVYEMLVQLMDSGMVKQEIYQSYEPTILNEARITLKRKVADEQQDRVHNNSALTQYAILLMPYAQNPTVKTLFDKIFKLKRQTMKMDICVEMLKHKIPVPDSIWQNLASDDMFRSHLYTKLEAAKQLSVFPERYKNQSAMARSLFVNQFSEWSFKNIDSLQEIEKREYSFKGQKGYIYLYKYKMKDIDEWHLGMTGLQPLDIQQWNLNREMLAEESFVLEKDKPQATQILKMIKETNLKARHRKGYYRAYDDDYE